MSPNSDKRATLKQSNTRPLTAVLLGGLLTVGALAGATAVFSTRTQDTTTTFANQLVSRLNATGKVTAQQTSYQKGFLSSTQTMTVTLKGTEQTGDKPVVLLVTNHIQHGPFPGFKAVGQAVVDTEVRFADAALQAKVDKALDGQKPSIHTLVGLGGDTHSTVTIPSGHMVDNVDSEGFTFTWKPLLGHVNVSGLSTTSDIQWPGLDMQGDDKKGHMLLENITMQGQQQKLSDTSLLTVGKTTFKMGAVRFVPSDTQAASSRANTPINLSNLEMVGESTQSSDKFIDTSVQYNIGEIGTAESSLKNVQLHMGLRHLASEPLERIVATFNTLQGSATEGKNTPDITDAQEKQFEADLLALVKAQPKITLDRLSVSQPSGDIVLTGEAAAPGLATMKTEDLAMLRQMPAMLISSLQVHLDAVAPRKALAELDALAGGRLNLLSSVDPLLGRGLLSDQGGTLKTAIVYADGKLTMNGKPVQ